LNNMSFLKAEWRKLAIANYQIEESLLSKYVPYGTEIDLWNGKCYVSLVGFMFLNTRVLGIKVPYHINFEEVNLRFYVKRKDQNQWKRGVVFIKEIVSRPALTFIANTVYYENYETMPMSHECREENELRFVEYNWKKDLKWQNFQITANRKSDEIKPGGETEFITEHYWGYAKVNTKKSVEYEVTHPKWSKYDIVDYEIEVDFGAVYGDEFGFLNQLNPTSVMLAEGSEITVGNKKMIE